MRIKQNKGFSILEVLIALVILVVGLLAATTLIIRSSQINVNAYETEQIAMLANSMIERIRANPDGIGTYKSGGSSKDGNCSNKSSSCDKTARANTDGSWFNEQIGKLLGNDATAMWSLSEDTSSNVLKGTTGKLYKLKITWGEAPKQNVYYLNFVL